MTKQQTKAPTKQLPNGKWVHIKSVVQFDDEIGAATDFRFCCEWEGR